MPLASSVETPDAEYGSEGGKSVEDDVQEGEDRVYRHLAGR